ncbi:MAG: tyrosine-type recombinase/integrase [Synechococcaceae cyanobacterium SM1_2_3]|nr:tyrosine-type recombinase/integrase [Synechococcaceae cyanobacterium SM1_2_3]
MYRKKGSPYWWIAYRDASGRKIEQSTQTTDRAKAALVESEKRAALWHEKQRGIIPQADPLFDEVMADYLEAAAARRSIERDVYAARHLTAQFAGVKMRAMTPADIEDYLTHRQRVGVSESTLKREMGVLKAAVNWANKKKRLDLPNPVARLDLVEPPGRVRWLDQDQSRALMDAAAEARQAPHLVDFIRLALHTGMRKSEMLGLEWGSIPLNGTARQAILNRARFRAEHCPAAAHVFCDARGRRIGNVQRSFVSACSAAGIVDFHIHDLRHTCAAWLVQAGVPLLDVSNLLRHASVVMTQRYAHLAPTSARNAVAKLDNPAGDNLATMAVGNPAEKCCN